MTFTTQPPTIPGAYWWKDVNHTTMRALVRVTNGIPLWSRMEGETDGREPKSRGGLWCGPLVPAEELDNLREKLTAEIEEAFSEGRESVFCGSDSLEDSWNNSRAKRITEGKE